MSLKYRALNFKRVFATAGACAIGSAGLHGANVTGLTPQEQSKWWLLSGSFSTFYDDNTFNRPDSVGSGANKVNYTDQGSLGLEFKPGVAVNLPGTRTLLAASYDYSLNFYENRPEQKLDQTHWFDFRVNHRLSERYTLEATDQLILADEPAVTGKTVTEFGREDASSLRNRAALEYTAVITPIFGLLAGYGHYLQDYENESYSRSLDHTENSLHADARWYRSQNHLYFAGYRLGMLDYTAPNFDIFRPPTTIHPNIKNTTTHALYVGGEQDLTRQLEARWYVGGQYADYYNSGESTISPYADANFTYTYQRDCTLRLGANIGRFASDTQIVDEESVTLDQLVYAVILGATHRITSRISGNVQFQFQHAVFNGGVDDGSSDDYLTFTLGADYKLREYLWATASYTFSKLSSGRNGGEALSFDKNRISFGIRATY